MTHCYNCGHTGTFVLLVQFALAVPGPDARAADPAVADRDAADARSADGPDAPADRRTVRADSERVPEAGDLSLAVQCPACDSTDVGVPAGDLLARYGATTTS